MSTIRAQNRRRRSHSASSALSSSSSSHRIAKKVAAKRSYPEASSSQLGEACRWDSDSFRRGKRRRRGLSAGSGTSKLDSEVLYWDNLAHAPLDGASASRISKSNGFPQASLRPSNSTFAMSADEFGLPVSKGKRREWPQQPPTLASPSSFMDVSDTQSEDYLRRLRFNAFRELERSVEEGGEGLIQRMRELEYLRSAFLYEGERGRPLRPQGAPSPAVGRSPGHAYPSSSDVSGDEDDDIQIYAGEPTSRSISRPPDTAMETDICQNIRPIFTTHHSFTSSPQSFGFLSAVEIPSHCCSSSPSSSSPSTSPQPESIPNLPSPSRGLPDSAPPGSTANDPHPLPPPSASDRVIDALTLALANGAGGLNYCAALPDVRDDGSAHHAGELWH